MTRQEMYDSLVKSGVKPEFVNEFLDRILREAYGKMADSITLDVLLLKSLLYYNNWVAAFK